MELHVTGAPAFLLRSRRMLIALIVIDYDVMLAPNRLKQCISCVYGLLKSIVIQSMHMERKDEGKYLEQALRLTWGIDRNTSNIHIHQYARHPDSYMKFLCNHHYGKYGCFSQASCIGIRLIFLRCSWPFLLNIAPGEASTIFTGQELLHGTCVKSVWQP